MEFFQTLPDWLTEPVKGLFFQYSVRGCSWGVGDMDSGGLFDDELPGRAMLFWHLLPRVGVGVPVRPQPLDLPHAHFSDMEPPENFLAPRLQPKLAEYVRGEREISQARDFFLIILIIEYVRVDMIPGLPDFDNTYRIRLEDQKIERKVRFSILHPAVSHPLRKSLRLGNRSCRFLPACHSCIPRNCLKGISQKKDVRLNTLCGSDVRNGACSKKMGGYSLPDPYAALASARNAKMNSTATKNPELTVLRVARCRWPGWWRSSAGMACLRWSRNVQNRYVP